MELVWIFLLSLTVWNVARRNWKQAVWFGSGTGFLMLMGSTPLSYWLAGEMEREYGGVPNEDRKADAVVMLGGMIRVSENDSFSISLGEASDRFVTAVELIRKGGAPVLVLGGSAALPGEQTPSATLLEKWARGWALTGVEILNLGLCENTYDEAVQTRILASERGWKKILLVTSALHMKRAEAVFRKQGLDVIPVACDFQSFGVANDTSFSFIPRQERFDILGRYLHEKVGWLYYWMKGRI